MIPAAMTPNSNRLCPKSRPAELETTLPCAATGDGRPDGGARVPPSCDDESAARSSPMLCECNADQPRGADAVVVTPSALGGGADAGDWTLAPGATATSGDGGAGRDSSGAIGARTGSGSNREASETAGCSAGGRMSVTAGKVGVNAFRSIGSAGSSGTRISMSFRGGAVESDGACDVDVLASSVCADAGDALSRSHAATASRPRRRKPPITATFVLMIGIERCIAPRNTGQWLHPATYPPSRADKQGSKPSERQCRTLCAVFTC
jgi:hypothetical protein